MKILAIDTSSDETSCSILADGNSYMETQAKANSHAESLFELLQNLSNRSNLKPKDIDIFISAIGPGSYTGVRIGLSALKGIAFAACKQIIGFTKFEVMAFNFTKSENYSDGEYLICLDGKREEVFVQKFSFSNKKFSQISLVEIISLENYKKSSEKKVVLENELQVLSDSKDILTVSVPNASDYASYYLSLSKNANSEQTNQFKYNPEPLYIRQPDYVKAGPRLQSSN